ncbi:hypothetical protein ACIBH1_36575 [Nonomuraea sp. NPDC050663]|uniref:hypothetical protein n=1 Tax=Nonomuraea sp. NPDC050663 TaxID=3364370 RepID=UPI0037A7A771
MSTNGTFNPALLFPVFLTLGVAVGSALGHLSAGVGVSLVVYAFIVGSAMRRKARSATA